MKTRIYATPAVKELNHKITHLCEITLEWWVLNYDILVDLLKSINLSNFVLSSFQFSLRIGPQHPQTEKCTSINLHRVSKIGTSAK